MEVEYGGIKASGGKLFIIISLIGTIGGGLWGFFELVKRYEDMEATISEYVAPDLSGFDKRLEVFDTKLTEKLKVSDTKLTEKLNSVNTDISALKELVTAAQETARDMRTDIKNEVNSQHDQIAGIDKRSREDGLETRTAMRNAENEVRDLISATSKRWDDKLTKVDAQIESLDKKLDKKITKALENPLAAMSKTK
jgi:phage host-nuclease inhibitor protein Gam